MLRKVLICSIAAIIMLFSCAEEEAVESFVPQDGDILFQDLDCGIYCESIESVTLGYKGANLSHCGMVVVQEDGLYVVEAISKGVSLTPLDSFLNRSYDAEGNPKVFVGRLKSETVREKASDLALKKLGKPYDEVYNIFDDTYYCSELIYHACIENGAPIFDLQPMTFKAKGTDSTFAAWQAYYDQRNLPVPEGELGLNPGGISLSEQIEVVHFYGKPDGVRI